MLIPSLKSTLVNNDGFEWRPATFSDCLLELEHIKTLIQECCYFRGQGISDRHSG
jgi:hypothetical protein